MQQPTLLSLLMSAVLAAPGCGIDVAELPSSSDCDDEASCGVMDPAAPACSDPDGRNYAVAGVTAWSGDNPGTGGDACVDFGIPDYGAVVDACRGPQCAVYELYCDGVSVSWEYVPCPSGCTAGVCSSSAPTCSDPDGRNYGVAGTTTWTGEHPGSTRDVCVDGSVGETGAVADHCVGWQCSVYELYCDGNEAVWEYVPCPSGCVDGACPSPDL